MNISPEQKLTIVTALRTAAEVYKKDAQLLDQNWQDRTATQFLKQHHDALQLADKIEEES